MTVVHWRTHVCFDHGAAFFFAFETSVTKCSQSSVGQQIENESAEG